MQTIHTIDTARPVRFLRGDLADRLQARRDARQLAETLWIEALLADRHVSAKV